MNDTTSDELKRKQQEELDDLLIYEKVYSTSPLSNDECAVCKRKGFPIFLVRKSIIPKEYDKRKNYWSTAMVSLESREPSVKEVQLQTHEYVYRTLRKGYVYILAKRFSGGYEPIGYEVTPSGVFRHKTRYDMKERNIKEIPEACVNDSHRIPGYFVNIDTTVYSDVAYVAYTRRAWSDSTVKTYLDMADSDPTNINLGRFSKITLSAEGMSDSTKLSSDKRSFACSKFFEPTGPKLLEFELTQDKVYCHNELSTSADGSPDTKQIDDYNNAVTNKLFVTCHPFRSLITKKEQKTENSADVSKSKNVQDSGSSSERGKIASHVKTLEDSHVSRITAKSKEGKDKSESVKVAVSALVVEDSFGLAEELCYQRQIKISPILELVYNAEKKYTTQMSQQYKNMFNSTSSLSDQFDVIRKGYEDDPKHGDEAKILFDEKYGKKFKKKKVGRKKKNYGDPINDNFLNESYYSSYSNLVSSGTSYRYFNEKLMHIRKHKSYIDSFYSSLEEQYRDTGDKVLYDYDTWVHSTRGMSTHLVYPKSKEYIAANYTEEIPTDQEKKNLLGSTEFNGSRTEIVGVRKFSIPNTAREERQKKLEKAVEKYNKLLANYRVEKFLTEDEKAYNELIESIKKNSMDYYNYTTWLFGYSEDGKTSAYTPQEVKTYNKLHFWRIECDSNSSNNHIGYLADFISIVDTLSLGNIKLDYQFGLWDILLQNKNTIYYHLITGDTNKEKPSFWSALLKIRKEFDIEKSELKAEANETGDNSEDDIIDYEALANEALTKLIKDHKQDLDSMFFLEKGAHILNMYQILVGKATSALAQRSGKSTLIDDELIQQHLIDAAMVISGAVGKVFTLEVKASQLREVIRALGDCQKVFTVSVPEKMGKELLMPAIKGNFLLEKDKTVLIDFFQLADDSYSLRLELQKFFDISLSEIYKELKGIPQTLKETWSPPLPPPPGSASSFKLVTRSGVALILNGISAYSNVMVVNHNYEILDNIGIGQTRQDELKMEIFKNQIQYITKCIIIFSDICNKLKDVAFISTFLSSKPTILLLSSNVFKAMSSVATVLGVVGPAISLWDGVMALLKARNTRDLPAHIRNTYYIAGTLTVISALITFAKLGGVLAGLGPWGFAIYLIGIFIGLVAALINFFFSDESDSWSRMETWFNRCLLGAWLHRDKGQPYPPNFEGIAFSANDYFVARTHIDCNIQLNKESYYVNELVPDRTYGDSHFIKGLYLFLELPGFDGNASIYECSVRLNKWKSVSKANMSISVKTGEKYPIISVGKQIQQEAWGASKTPIFVRRDEKLLMPVTKLSDLGEKNKVDIIEQVGFDEDAIAKKQSPFYRIRYKLGEISAPGMKIYCKLFYYPNGKGAKDGDIWPLILDYEYTVK